MATASDTSYLVVGVAQHIVVFAGVDSNTAGTGLVKFLGLPHLQSGFELFGIHVGVCGSRYRFRNQHATGLVMAVTACWGVSGENDIGFVGSYEFNQITDYRLFVPVWIVEGLFGRLRETEVVSI